jgi:hypothetical protein
MWLSTHSRVLRNAMLYAALYDVEMAVALLIACPLSWDDLKASFPDDKK